MKITESFGSRVLFIVAVFFFVAPFAVDAAGTVPTEPGAIKAELVEIMKGVNFVPQLGKDDPFCKAFYDDFKTQTNIEHNQPIARAESYDDPALKPYREKCPELDFRMSGRVSGKADISQLSEEEREGLGTPSYGLGHFEVYRLDMARGVDDNKYIFYYEGERTRDRRLGRKGQEVVKDIVSPRARGFNGFDLNNCRRSDSVHFDTGHERSSRNGLVHYKNRNAIFVLRSYSKEPDFWDMELYAYSSRLSRIAPVCSYTKRR